LLFEHVHFDINTLHTAPNIIWMQHNSTSHGFLHMPYHLTYF